MPKFTEKSWERLENLRKACFSERDTITHNKVYVTWEDESERDAEIYEAEMRLEHCLREYHRLLIAALESYTVDSEQRSLEEDWPAIKEKGLRTTDIISVSNGEFAESQGLNRLETAFVVLTTAREAELAEFEEARARDEAALKLAELERQADIKKSRMQAVTGLVGVLAGGILTLLASSPWDCAGSSSAEPTSVEGSIDIKGQRAVNLRIRCQPEIEGVSSLADGTRYIVQTNGSVPLPMSVACVVADDGRTSQPVIVRLSGGQVVGPTITLSAE